jgi:KaiC/GvpD/RAD55 family RecA-like ATPase
MITFTSSVRGNDAPLGRSFDLKKPEQQKTVQRRCDSCNALIRIQPGKGKERCPICGAKMNGGADVSSAMRSILDQGKIAYKAGDLSTAKDLYGIALKQDPNNKEAKFFLMKLKRGGSGSPRGGIRTSLDSRDISSLSSGLARLDQMIGGGVNVGSQILIKGPPYSGKDVLLDYMMASALRSGFPVIYVSSNRAMKDVMKGIVNQIPDFKKFNQSRRVRMYDLFSKHKGEQVLREGHRIFNIEVKADFKRFQSDLVMVQESLVQEYGGGVMIINSLSPLITQVDQNDLMKFLQVLIARSKGYRFTNVMDLASGIHQETIVNSVEYLMDGTLELRELDSRFSIRLRGFRQNIATKDWVDYKFTDSSFDLVGSFNEERIV